MKYLTCQCGQAQYYSSGIWPMDCEGCARCGMTYASHPDGHKPRIEHEWEPRYNSRTGEQDRRVCKRCHRSETVT